MNACKGNAIRALGRNRALADMEHTGAFRHSYCRQMSAAFGTPSSRGGGRWETPKVDRFLGPSILLAGIMGPALSGRAPAGSWGSSPAA